MILSDVDLRKRQAIDRLLDPFDDSLVQPASVDVRLGHRFQVQVAPRLPTFDAIDPRAGAKGTWREVVAEGDKPMRLRPESFALGHTVETVTVPDDLCAEIRGKSSLGRLGLLIHATAGFLDPGFVGQVTLELANVGRETILLWPGMAIAQVSFAQLSTSAERPYGSPGLGSHYQGQTGPTLSRYGEGE